MKKTRILSFMASAVAAVALLTGCSTENDFENGKDGLASLELSSVSSSDMLTRAVIDGTTFPTDKGNIGLFLYAKEDASEKYGDGYANVQYSYDDSKSKWTASPSIKVGSMSGYLYGYYPYNAANTDVKAIPVTSSVNGDDVMYASKQEQPITDLTAANTNLTMNHALARVAIKVINNGYTGSAKLTSIKFAGAKTSETGTLDATTGTISGTTRADVTLTVPSDNQTITSDGTTYECLLVPSEKDETKQEVTLTLTIDGTDKTLKLSGDNGVIFKPGVKSTVTITLSNTGIALKSVSINDWQTVKVGEHTVTVKLSEDAGIVKDVMVTAYIENENVVVKTYSDSKKPLIIREEDGKLIVPEEDGNKSTFTISDITSDITATLAYAKTRTVTFNKKVDMAPNVEGYNYGKAEPITVLEGRSSTLTATPGEGYAFDYFDVKGTRYGDKAKVIIPNDVETIDAYFHLSDWLGGVFSVSGNTKVRFSRGNLWCDADYGDYDYDYVVKEGRFHFEKNQNDFNDNGRSGFKDDDHVSHFFWCKDADNSVCYRYHKEWDNYDGVLFTNETETTPNPNFEVDGQKGFWRTLSKTEWEYLLNRKDKDGNLLYRKNVRVSWSGLVLLPDDWDWSTAPGGGWKSEYSETTSPKWSEMEAAGAVFLPGAGSRDDTDNNPGHVDNYCYYWTSSWVGNYNYKAYILNFISDPEVEDKRRNYALPIRVVTEAK